MNMVNHLPGITIAVLLALLIGFVVRFLLEGASIKVAMVSLIRFFFLPLAYVAVINSMVDGRRKVIFDAKSSGVFSDNAIKVMEDVLSSKSKFAWLCFKVSFRMFRSIMDVYISASIQYETSKTAMPNRKKKKDEKKFFEFFLNSSDVSHRLFQGR